jgi:xanthine dehydrogenase accessory factor
MRRSLELARRWRTAGLGVGRAVVVRTIGPSPFGVGSTLLVADDGRLAGAVSAGCFEGWAAEAILAARRGRYREVVRLAFGDAEAAEAGVACGGGVDVLVEPDVPDALLEAAAAGRSVVVATPLPVERAGPPWLRVVLGSTGIEAGSLGDPALDAALDRLAAELLRDGASRTVSLGGAELFVEVLPPPPRLIVVGAGEIAVELVRLAHALDFRTVVIDARSAFLTRERFPEADVLLLGWADELAEAAGLDAESIVVALAHDARFDDPAIVAALRRGAWYVGALGSRRTHEARLERLRAVGLGETDLARIHAPVGLDLGGRTAVDIAVGILAEIVAESNRARRGRVAAAPELGAGG